MDAVPGFFLPNACVFIVFRVSLLKFRFFSALCLAQFCFIIEARRFQSISFLFIPRIEDVVIACS